MQHIKCKKQKSDDVTVLITICWQMLAHPSAQGSAYQLNVLLDHFKMSYHCHNHHPKSQQTDRPLTESTQTKRKAYLAETISSTSLQDTEIHTS